MSLFKSKGLEEELIEFFDQEIEDLQWLENKLKSCKDKKIWEEELDQTSDRLKHVNKLLKKLKG
jgi:hypothetical protein